MEQEEPKISFKTAVALVISSSFLITVLVLAIFITNDKKRSLNINKRAASTVAVSLLTTPPIRNTTRIPSVQGTNSTFEIIRDVFEGKTKIPDAINQVLYPRETNYSQNNNYGKPEPTEAPFFEDESYEDNSEDYIDEFLDETPTPELTTEPIIEPTLSPATSEPISATSTPIVQISKLGDANGDNIVNDIDYTIWLSNYQNSSSCGVPCGDFNSDGTTNSLDYIIWVNNFEG